MPQNGRHSASLKAAPSNKDSYGLDWTGHCALAVRGEFHREALVNPAQLADAASSRGSRQICCCQLPEKAATAYQNLAAEAVNDGDLVFATTIPNQGIAVQSLGTGEWRTLIEGQEVSMPGYSSSGHLIYFQAGNLMAVPFDLDRLQVKGAAVPVVQGVQQSENVPWAAQYSVSETGTLVYFPGSRVAVQSRLVWVSRSGAEQLLPAATHAYDMPRLSPDGRRVALDLTDNGLTQVWLYELSRDILSRFTFEGIFNAYPVWTPDGKRIAFDSNKGGQSSLSWQMADGSGGPERLTTTTALAPPFSWSPDGRLLAFDDLAPTTGRDIWMLRVDERKAQPFLQTPAFEDAPQFSPDGHWLAYASDESGSREIYVQPYPGPGGKWQISNEGGTEPMWNRNGRELFYRIGDKMMAVDVSTQPGFAAGKPRQLFEGHYLMNSAGYARPDYDVSPDGQRFLMLKPVEQEQAGTAPTQIIVVQNWTEELKRLVPTGK